MNPFHYKSLVRKPVGWIEFRLGLRWEFDIISSQHHIFFRMIAPSSVHTVLSEIVVNLFPLPCTPQLSSAPLSWVQSTVYSCTQDCIPATAGTVHMYTAYTHIGNILDNGQLGVCSNDDVIRWCTHACVMLLCTVCGVYSVQCVQCAGVYTVQCVCVCSGGNTSACGDNHRWCVLRHCHGQGEDTLCQTHCGGVQCVFVCSVWVICTQYLTANYTVTVMLQISQYLCDSLHSLWYQGLCSL